MQTITKICVTLAFVSLITLAVLAQDASSTQPPAPTVPTSPKTWVYILSTAAITAAVIFLSIMPSKRAQNQE